MGDEKNFRSQFYGKVGLLEVEEKRAIEALLRETPLNGKEFSNFARRSIVPVAYKNLVWKLMLGITPRYAESQDYVTQQQAYTFEELWCALKALRLTNISLGIDGMNGHETYIVADSRKVNTGTKTHPETPYPEHHVLMWLMSEAKLLYNPRQQLMSKENQHFISIARKVSSFFDNPVEIYHVCSALWALILKNQASIVDAVQEAIGVLRKEHDVYHLHLLKAGLFSSSLLFDHCFCLFCDIFPESAIEKILDKVIAKAFRILSFVTVALLVHLRRSIASVYSVEGIRSLMCQIRKEEADVIVTAALELWAITQSGFPRTQRLTSVT
ncbi:TBC1 domain family member 7 [Palaemon carinicauda]|uniref:TBC1 domain family member 7 n=1 Tax=Palaemon carinicauda TaxID=392227 RepID=UPI0035B584CE